jgi:hypothetical protein
MEFHVLADKLSDALAGHVIKQSSYQTAYVPVRANQDQVHMLHLVRLFKSRSRVISYRAQLERKVETVLLLRRLVNNPHLPINPALLQAAYFRISR